MNIPTANQTGIALERAARTIAPLIAATYVAGYMLGQWLHRINDRLAGVTPPAPAPAPRPTEQHWRLEDCIPSYRAAGWSQQRIADMLGVSRTTVRRRIAAMA